MTLHAARGIVPRGAVIKEPLIQQLAVFVSHDRNDVADQRHQTTQFAVVLTGDLHHCVGNSLLDQLAKLKPAFKEGGSVTSSLRSPAAPTQATGGRGVSKAVHDLQ